MDYHLDRQLQLNGSPEHLSLYRWSINEIDGEGQVVGPDFIPWGWTLSFTGTSIELIDSIDIKTEGPADRVLARAKGVTERRLMRVKLRPGELAEFHEGSHPNTYRMFGTDREIRDFRLEIVPLIDGGKEEECRAWGGVSYTSEMNFRDVTTADVVCFYLAVMPETFDRYTQRIADGTVDDIVLRVGAVEGFYSEWSPDIDTELVKVLAPGDEQAVEMPDETARDVPRLGAVGYATLSIRAMRQFGIATSRVDDEL